MGWALVVVGGRDGIREKREAERDLVAVHCTLL